MGPGTLREMIAVIRTEQQRRESLLRDSDPESYFVWRFENEPIVTELCLMLLVSLRHQVERDLVDLAALSANEGKEISGSQYEENIESLRTYNKKRQITGWKWDIIKQRLSVKTCENYELVEALRLLANAYKHEPSVGPTEELLKLLKLETADSYLPLTQSDALREGLAALIGLEKDTEYCDIAERFVDIACDFIKSVKSRARLSRRGLNIAPAGEFAR